MYIGIGMHGMGRLKGGHFSGVDGRVDLYFFAQLVHGEMGAMWMAILSESLSDRTLDECVGKPRWTPASSRSAKNVQPAFFCQKGGGLFRMRVSAQRYEGFWLLITASRFSCSLQMLCLFCWFLQLVWDDEPPDMMTLRVLSLGHGLHLSCCTFCTWRYSSHSSNPCHWLITAQRLLIRWRC